MTLSCKAPALPHQEKTDLPLTHSIPYSQEFSFERSQKVFSGEKFSFMGTNIFVTRNSLSNT